MSRTSINAFLLKALASPELQRALVQVNDAKTTRPVRSCRCEVVEIPEGAQAEDFTDITPGTVTAVVAREGDPLVRKLVETVGAKNGKEFNLTTSQIRQMGQEASRKILGGERYPKSQPADFPSFVQISYGNKSLSSHVHVDEILRAFVHVFPYNGGFLDRNAFSMIEYYRNDVETPMTCVLLIRQPKLSEIEREALRLVPSSASANNVAPGPCEPITPALLAFLVVAAEVAAQWLYNEFVKLFLAFIGGGGTILTAMSDAVLRSEDFQNKLKSLPPEVTAAELLRLRTDILLEEPGK